MSDVRVQGLSRRAKLYLDGNEQRKWEEQYDQYERKQGQHVATASQALFSRCSYFDICRGKRLRTSDQC